MMAVVTMDAPPPVTMIGTILPEECERLLGGSVKVCRCRVDGGWLPCPPQARGKLEDAPIPCPVASIPPPAAAAAQIGSTNENAKSDMPPLSGDLCTNCQTFTMVRTGTCLTCQLCGDSSGGCS